MSKFKSPTLRFMGATGTVTGSRYLVEAEGRRILVDCGLFQGYKQLRQRNRRPFPVRPRSIDTVLLTHAHLDHSGYIPALMRAGFSGRVICTASTEELAGLILPDSGHLQEEEAKYARRKKYSKHARPEPLYTFEEAKEALTRFDAVGFSDPVDLGDGITADFIPAGHLLGAAQIRLNIAGTVLHFSGDLGRDTDPLMRPPVPFGGALAAGADHLRIFGKDFPIEAEVIQMGSFSGHADANELMRWLGAAPQPPRMTYITHGEPDAADALRFRIEHELGWNARVPEHLETIQLERPR